MMSAMTLTSISEAWEPLTSKPPRGGRPNSNNSTSKKVGDVVSPVPSREDFGTEASYRSMSENADRYCKDTGVCANEGMTRRRGGGGKRENFEGGEKEYKKMLADSDGVDDAMKDQLDMERIGRQVRPLDEPVPSKYDASALEAAETAPLFGEGGFDDFDMNDVGAETTILPRGGEQLRDARSVSSRRSGAAASGDDDDAATSAPGGYAQRLRAAAARISVTGWFHETLLLVLVSALFLLVAKLVMDAGYFFAMRQLVTGA